MSQPKKGSPYRNRYNATLHAKAALLYIQGWSTNKIAKRYGVDKKSVANWVREAGYELRFYTGSPGKSDPSITKIVREVLIRNGVPISRCQDCNKVFGVPLNVHHIDQDRTNNSINNLAVLCPSCHTHRHPRRKCPTCQRYL
jgi:hypothetical protein